MSATLPAADERIVELKQLKIDMDKMTDAVLDRSGMIWIEKASAKALIHAVLDVAEEAAESEFTPAPAPKP